MMRGVVPEIIVFGLPPLLLAALSFAFRRRGLGTHVLIWLVGFPDALPAHRRADGADFISDVRGGFD
jgi:hypothetical protein